MADEHKFKILLVGNSLVGKSSLLTRFTNDTFEPLQSTIGVDFVSKAIHLDGRRVKMTIWDTAGQERFRTLTSAYYRGAHGILLVYDVTDRASFDALKTVWLQEVSMAPAASIKMIVGNKTDLPSRTVSREEGMAFAREQSTLFVEASAKTADGVQATFEELVRKILQTPALVDADSARAGAVRPGGRGADDAAASSYSDCAC